MGVNKWRDSKESRDLEAYRRVGQGPLRAVAPSKKEVLRYKESLCQWMYKEKGMSLTFLILLLVIYKNGCCMHLRLLTAVENFAGEHSLNVMDCNGTVALIL
jgi:hypothetical protein